MALNEQTPRTSEPPQVGAGLREFNILDATFSIGGLQNRLFQLLSAIDEAGSLVAASKKAGLSYKGAWDMIERASLLSPRPLIDRSPGGGADRGTRLTETGRALLEIHRRLEVRKKDLLKALNREFSLDPILLQWYHRLILKSSARNQWRAEVLSIKMGVIKSEVSVRLPDGAILIANLDRESTSQLQLEFGTHVIALVKASMVHLVTEAEDFLFSAENQFEGRVSEILQDAVTVEIFVDLPSGDRIVTTLSLTAFLDMGVEEGDRVTIFFDSEAVILASLPKDASS
jgi:molybdate transport system regulatory protein